MTTVGTGLPAAREDDRPGESPPDGGVVVLPLLEAAEVESMRWAFDVLGPVPGDGNLVCARSEHCPDPGYRHVARSVAITHLAPPLGRIGLGGEALVDAGFVMAWPGPHSGEGADRGAGPRTVTGFLALDEVTPENGGWWVVPADHATSPERHGRTVRLSPGQAVLVEGGRCTFTLANRIDKPRLGVAFTVRADLAVADLSAAVLPAPLGDDPPAEAPYPERDRCATCGRPLEAIDDRWSRRVPARCSPGTRHGAGACDAVVPWVQPAPPSEADDHLAFRVRTHAEPWERAFVTSPGGPVARPPAAERALRDPLLDAALERDGYLAPAGPRLDPERARALRSAFLEQHGPGGRGFHNDFNDRDLGYRRSVARLVAEVLDPVVDELFAGHVGFLHPFLCKFPGETSYFKPHRDWMYVDERSGHRSFVLFVALEDTTEENGQVELIPGSHRLDAMLRGTLLEAPWMRRTEVLTPRMQAFPRQAGEVLIWDHALVHGSFPNLTPHPRVAAAVWVAPADTPLLHYRRLDEDRAWCHAVGRDFWAQQNPFRLMVHAPAEPVVDRVPVGGAELAGDALSDALEAGEQMR